MVLVMDASGSMWGVVDGQPKIEVARTVVGELVSSLDPRFELGLTVYGHRRKGDCSDIEALLPVAAPDAESLVAAVESIRPKGKTPLGASLEYAAEQLDFTRAPATVVLVSDGNETCDVDPCAVAHDLEARGIDFTAHVVGFGVTPAERAQLECIADATDGLFLTANDTPSLRSALGRALSKASGQPGSGLWLAASLGPGGQPLGDSVGWRIHHLVQQPGGTLELGTLAFESSQATIGPKLEPGRYRAFARYHGITGVADLVIQQGGRASHVVDLQAGRIEVSGVVQQGERRIDGGLHWQVRRARNGQPGPLVAETRVSSHTFTLPAGRYFIDGEYDGARVTREVELRPGKHVRKRVSFGVGRLALRAILSSGGQPILEDIAWSVHRTKKRFGAPEAEVASELRPTGLHSLPTGHYRVTARYGHTTAHEWVEVMSGKTVTLTLDLAAGEVRVFGSLPPPGGSIHDSVEWRIHPLRGRGAKRDESVAASSKASELFVLPAGRYLVQGEYRGMQGAAEVTLSPGQATSVNVTFQPPAPARSRR